VKYLKMMIKNRMKIIEKKKMFKLEAASSREGY
jgi:hypothetical protein